MTPIYFHDYTVKYFPKIMQDFFTKEQQQQNCPGDASNRQIKMALKHKVDDDWKRFLGTLILIFFKL
jgi:hypothetical protein